MRPAHPQRPLPLGWLLRGVLVALVLLCGLPEAEAKNRNKSKLVRPVLAPTRISFVGTRGYAERAARARKGRGGTPRASVWGGGAGPDCRVAPCSGSDGSEPAERVRRVSPPLAPHRPRSVSDPSHPRPQLGGVLRQA